MTREMSLNKMNSTTHGGSWGGGVHGSPPGAYPENNLTGFQFTRIIYKYMCICVSYMYHIYHIHAGVRVFSGVCIIIL